MLFHLSIDADRPQAVAEALAEIIGGEALPFPPVAKGSWMALGAGRNAPMIEVYPRGTELHPGEGSADAVGIAGPGAARTPTHFAIGTRLKPQGVLRLAARMGWPAKQCCRGGKFGVLELWIEGRVMFEVLTPAMQAQYRLAMTIPSWRTMLGLEETRRAAA